MLSYEEFKAAVLQRLAEFLPDATADNMELRQTEKNNITLEVLLINQLVNGNVVGTTTLYLEEYYSQYKSGTDLYGVMHRMAQDYTSFCNKQLESDLASIANKLQSYDYAADHIICSLVGQSRNKVMLSHQPYVKVEDMAVIFHIDLKGFGIEAVANIDNEIAKEWGITPEELFEQAKKNMPRLHPDHIIDISPDGMLAAFMGFAPSVEEFEPSPDCLLYALTTTDNNRGAATVVYPGLLEELHGKLGDFFLIPSSIHEMLICRCELSNAETLQEICAEVNGMVNVQEQLTNSIYKYDGKALSIASPDPKTPDVTQDLEPKKKPPKRGTKL